jgi:hypothetical protein
MCQGYYNNLEIASYIEKRETYPSLLRFSSEFSDVGGH